MNTQPGGLDHKNRLYSILLALLLLCFLVGYFLYMLPSLYVDYRMEQNLKAVKMQHETYVKTGSYEGTANTNPTSCISIRIPYEGNSIFLTNTFFHAELTAKDGYVRTILHEFQDLLHNYVNTAQNKDTLLTEQNSSEVFSETMDTAFHRWKELLKAEKINFSSLPFTISATPEQTATYESQYAKLHIVSDHYLIAEATAADRENTYTSYFAMENVEDGLILTIFSCITPDMNDIRPVVLQSLPMIGAIILLVVLIFSQVYSRGILTPLYAALKKQNQALEEENKRQELFMRASSHKLKTPLSAALLLLDGMIGRVGKYKDTQIWLPKVKSQLLSMRKMVEDILSLNYGKEQLQYRTVNLIALLDYSLESNRIAISDKKLQIVHPDTKDVEIVADEYLLTQILDNIISNAVKYTPAGESIEIRTDSHALSIENHGVTIPEDILPHVFDPFVSGNHEHDNAGHGLGLYIASYYAKQMDFSLFIENRTDRVVTTLIWKKLPADL